jgi:hypothetical protein
LVYYPRLGCQRISGAAAVLCHRIFFCRKCGERFLRRNSGVPKRATFSPEKKWHVTLARVCIYGTKLSADPFRDVSSPLILILPYLFAVGGKTPCPPLPPPVPRLSTEGASSPIATLRGPASDVARLVGLARRFWLRRRVPPHRCHRATVSRLSFWGHTISYAGMCICTSPNRKVFLGS